jgi:hypothetical protein
MGKRLLSLGKPAQGSNNGITCSGSTNAKPIVVTLGAGHGLQNGDRIHISGITGNTAANGDWELAGITATTAQLVGSSGNGSHGGTAVVSVICDRTPFMAGRAALVLNGTGFTDGSLLIQGSDDGTTFSALATVNCSNLGATIEPFREITLKRYMKCAGSASTGAASVSLIGPH